MNKTNTKKLIKAYPDLYPKNFHFEHHDGWYKIIADLSDQLNLIQKSIPININILQAKEKFGSLRFYADVNCTNQLLPKPILSVWLKIIYNLIKHCENSTYHICENCGKFSTSGPSDYNGWIRVLCKKCEEKMKNTS